MSLDLTGEPFPRWHDGDCSSDWDGTGCDCSARKPMPPRTQRCSNGHIAIWYDSTDSDKCPLCSVRERRE